MSNESMANQITDVPSAIAELLAVNKQLEQELQKTREQLDKEINKVSELALKSSYLESMMPKLSEKMLIHIKDPMPQCFRCGYVRKEFETDYKDKTR